MYGKWTMQSTTWNGNALILPTLKRRGVSAFPLPFSAKNKELKTTERSR